MSTLHVRVQARIDEGPAIFNEDSTVIPPDYDPMDTAALTVRKIEDAAFELCREAFGRRPTRAALVASAARLRGIELALQRMPRTGVFAEHYNRIAAIFELTNDQATAQWGEDPEE